jgi:cyclohexanone monooxygenase
MNSIKKFDVIVVGAGFAGLYALQKLKSLGFSVLVLERAEDLGGTWFWNRYPGARCDVNSMEYSYQFSEELQQEWEWSEKYAPQAEILAYANHVADRFNLRPNIQFSANVDTMIYCEKSSTWQVTIDSGEQFSANVCIMATGCLSKPNIPDIKGLADFEGPTLHTGTWPKEPVNFQGKHVGIIGTGSSAIQSTPLIAEKAKKLTVFQRTPSFSIPAHNEPMNKEFESSVKSDYRAFRDRNSEQFSAQNLRPNMRSARRASKEELQKTYEERWQKGGLAFQASFKDLIYSEEANRTAVDFVHQKIKSQVSDPSVAQKLCPETILGCKRLCVDTGYYKTFNRENVSLVSLRETPIETIIKTGIKTTEKEYDLDMLVLATGFDAMTGALLSIDIQGRNSLPLTSKWKDGASNYLGLTVHGFPNLFTVTGPGSPSALANVIVAIEQHINWIADCLVYMKDRSLGSIEAEADAEESWVKHVNSIADRTLLAHGCASWYTGANIPGKPRIFMPYMGFPDYVSRCNNVASNDYLGFNLKA